MTISKIQRNLDLRKISILTYKFTEVRHFFGLPFFRFCTSTFLKPDIVWFKKGKMVFLKTRFSCTKKNIIGCKFEWFAHYCVNFGKVKGTYEKPWIIVLWDYFVNYGILCCCLHLMHFLWTPFFALKIDVLKFTGSLKAEWRRRYPSKGSWVCHLLEVWKRTKYYLKHVK